MTIKTLRKQIDELDQQLVSILAKRFKIAEKISVEKKKLKMPVRNLKREKEMLKQRTKWFKRKGFSDSGFVKTLFNIILKKSRMLQRNGK